MILMGTSVQAFHELYSVSFITYATHRTGYKGNNLRESEDSAPKMYLGKQLKEHNLMREVGNIIFING